MTKHFALPALLGILTCLSGCGTYYRRGLDPIRAQQVQRELVPGKPAMPRELEDKVLALNPEQVTPQEIESVLLRAPAPQIIKIHGGIIGVMQYMVSFSDFLQGMGYPGASLTNAGDGTATFSCYERSEKIAGVIAWYYEQEGLRPMMVGHSQGGIQVVKILDRLAGSSKLHVYNPLTWKQEARFEIVDPLTGQNRPVVGLKLSYVSTVGAGGLARLLPNQWGMNGKLRNIPDTVEEFTGFCKKNDVLGGDFFGYGPANHSKASGTAMVRQVWLPASYSHCLMPDTAHLLKSQAIKDWINSYHPSQELVTRPKLDVKLEGNTRSILWAADVWYSIKKHWVLELQRYIRARRSLNHDH